MVFSEKILNWSWLAEGSRIGVVCRRPMLQIRPDGFAEVGAGLVAGCVRADVHQHGLLSICPFATGQASLSLKMGKRCAPGRHFGLLR